jgi:hypothetical protein
VLRWGAYCTSNLAHTKGTQTPTPPLSGIIVATIEKAHALVQRLLEEDGLGALGCVVVDELHMVRWGVMGLVCVCLPFAFAALLTLLTSLIHARNPPQTNKQTKQRSATSTVAACSSAR